MRGEKLEEQLEDTAVLELFLRVVLLVISKALQVFCACRVQRITNTARALGGGTGWCHPVDCQSKLPIEHTATPIWISTSSDCACVPCFDRHCQHQCFFRPMRGEKLEEQLEDTALLELFLRVVLLVISKALQVFCACRVQRITNTARALGGGTGWCHPVDRQSKLPTEHTATPI